MPRRISRNDPCPCGSGKKFKQCCIRKDIDWFEMEDGSIGRQVPLSDEMLGVLDDIRELQIAQFGSVQKRLFDGAPPLEQMEFWTVQAMERAGIEPAMIYAYEKTDGLLLFEKNLSKTPDVDIAAWDRAIDEYERKTGVKAKRRRLSDNDFEAILASGPPSRQASPFVDRLPIRPPFKKEDWAAMRLSELVEKKDVWDYFQQCLAEATRQRGEMYFGSFAAMAHLGGRPVEGADYSKVMAEAMNRSFDADELESGLECVFLTCQPDGGTPNAVAAFEFLAFVGDCIGQYAEKIGAADQLANVLTRIRVSSLAAFAAAVGAELGVKDDEWKSERPR